MCQKHLPVDEVLSQEIDIFLKNRRERELEKEEEKKKMNNFVEK